MRTLQAFVVAMTLMASLMFAVGSGVPVSPESPRGLGKAHFQKECKGLSSHSQLQFASKLNETNLKLFCGKFSDAQRDAAMELFEENEEMTPDEAVAQIAKSKG